MGRKKSDVVEIDPVHWSKDMVWDLLAKMKAEGNRKVLFGKRTGENSSRNNKMDVYKRIAQELLPDIWAVSETTAADRIKNKIESLFKTYKTHALRLQSTGEGVAPPPAAGTPPEGGNGETDVFSDCYIGSEGPDATTTPYMKNIWEDITKKFIFFPKLHELCASRPNMIPVAVTTGVGPNGRRTQNYQAPEGANSTASEEPSEDLLPTQPEFVPASQSTFNGVIDPALAPPPSHSTPTSHHLGSQVPPARVPFGNVQPLNVGIPFYPQTPGTPYAVRQGIPVGPLAHQEKENVQPTYPPVPSSTPATPTTPGPAGRQPQASSFGSILEKAKSRIPAKRTIEDRLSEMASESMALARKRHDDEQTFKNRQLDIQERELLMKEFKEGLIDLDEYRERLDGMKRQRTERNSGDAAENSD